MCVFSQIKDRKHIEHNFHSVARVMPRGWTYGCWGESKTLAWGFAMAPHRLRTLVLFLSPNDIVGAIIHSTEIMLSILFLSLNAIMGAIRNSTEIVLYI